MPSPRVDTVRLDVLRLEVGPGHRGAVTLGELRALVARADAEKLADTADVEVQPGPAPTDAPQLRTVLWMRVRQTRTGRV